MFKDTQEGKTHFADDDTLKYISRLEKKVALYGDFIETVRQVTELENDGAKQLIKLLQQGSVNVLKRAKEIG